MLRAELESSNAERLEFIYLNMVGQTLCVHTIDGAVTEGLFVSRTDDDADHAAILLSRSRNRRSERCSGLDEHQTHDLLAILLSDIVFWETNPIRVEAAAAGRVEPYRSGMLTEMNWAEIPPEDDRMAGDLETEERAWVAGKWDQFEANRKFGVVSTYSEDQYTTKLDKTKFTREQVALADRLSQEIERSQARGGIQHRIERGEEVEGDEGALYSDVGRTKPGAATSTTELTKRSTPTTGKSPAYVVPRKGSATGGTAGTTGGSSGGSPLTVEEPADISTTAQQQQQQQQPQQQQSPPTPIEAVASPSAASTPSNATAPTTSGVGAKASSLSSSSLKSLNSNAKPFVPGGGGGAAGAVVGNLGSAPVVGHPHTVAPPVVIEDMMATVSKAVEVRHPQTNAMLALFAPAEWLGDDETDDPSIQFYANQTQLLHHGGGPPHQHHAPPHAPHHIHQHQHVQHHHNHHHHHLHQQHHHHHQSAMHHHPQQQPHGHHQQVMHHHHVPPQQQQPQQGMPQHSGGHPQQYHAGGGGGFAAQGHFAASQSGSGVAASAQQYRQSPHSPTGGPGGPVAMPPGGGGAGGFGPGGSVGGHVDPRSLPSGGAPRPTPMGKSVPQQPQQPIVAAPSQVGPNSAAGGPSAPVSVSEEPRRGMVVMRGARGAVNPTRHEESPPPQASAPPTTVQSTAGQIPGASAVVKKKSGK